MPSSPERRSVSRSDWRYIADVPFDFDRRRASVLVEKDGRRLLIVKGASEDILSLSVQVETQRRRASAG